MCWNAEIVFDLIYLIDSIDLIDYYLIWLILIVVKR